MMNDSGNGITTLGLVLALLGAVSCTSSADTPHGTVVDEAYVSPRTPDGQPDLQGYWSNATLTPLERPDNVSKAYYTPEELNEYLVALQKADFTQTEPGSADDVHYDLTQFGLARSQRLLDSNLRTSLIIDPANGKLPARTARGERTVAEAEEHRRQNKRFDAVEYNQLDDRCLLNVGSGPPMMDPLYNANNQIIQTPGYVVILVEMMHDVRIIPLGKKPHPDQNVQRWLGASRGHWDGETLVIKTKNFNGKNPFQGSDKKTMVVTERLTRVADDKIKYSFTIDDPEMWVQPWTGQSYFLRGEGPLFEFSCHEGNYGLYHELESARIVEKEAALSKSKVEADAQ